MYLKFSDSFIRLYIQIREVRFEKTIGLKKDIKFEINQNQFNILNPILGSFKKINYKELVFGYKNWTHV